MQNQGSKNDKIFPAHTKRRRKYWTNSDIEYRVSKSNPSLTLCSKLDKIKGKKTSITDLPEGNSNL